MCHIHSMMMKSPDIVAKYSVMSQKRALNVEQIKYTFLRTMSIAIAAQKYGNSCFIQCVNLSERLCTLHCVLRNGGDVVINRGLRRYPQMLPWSDWQRKWRLLERFAISRAKGTQPTRLTLPPTLSLSLLRNSPHPSSLSLFPPSRHHPHFPTTPPKHSWHGQGATLPPPIFPTLPRAGASLLPKVTSTCTSQFPAQCPVSILPSTPHILVFSFFPTLICTY